MDLSLYAEQSFADLAEENRELRTANLRLRAERSVYKKQLDKIEAAFFQVKVATVKAHDVLTDFLLIEPSPEHRPIDQGNGKWVIEHMRCGAVAASHTECSFQANIFCFFFRFRLSFDGCGGERVHCGCELRAIGRTATANHASPDRRMQRSKNHDGRLMRNDSANSDRRRHSIGQAQPCKR